MGKWLTQKLVDPYRREYQEAEAKVDDDGCTMEGCYCSECGKYLVGSDEYKCYGNFCPYCGSDMRAETQDDKSTDNTSGNESKLFLSLDNAVEIAVREFDADADWARIEFEQKCYISDDQYEIGFYDGVGKSLDAVRNLMDNIIS